MPEKKPPSDREPPPTPQYAPEVAGGPPTLAAYQRIYENMSDAFAAVNMEGVLTVCNRPFEQLLGYSAKELTGMTWQDLVPGDHHGGFLERIDQAAAGEDITAVHEHAIRRKDGTILQVDVRPFPLQDDDGQLTGFAAILRDITATKSLEEHLEKANTDLQHELAEKADRLEETTESFRRLSKAAYQGIVVSHDGLILDCNEQFASLVGRTIKELLGTSGAEVVDPSCQEHVINRAMASDENPYETRLKRPDGTVFPVEIRARMVRAGGRLIRVSAIRDLSDIKRMKDEIQGRQFGSEELRQRAANLTPREREIVNLVAQGLLNKEIADRLDLALITVKVHRGRAMRKLKAGNAAELGKIAIQAGIFKPK